MQSVCPVGKMHPYWMKKLGGVTGDELLMYEDNAVYRRQDLPPVYMLDGGVIAVRRASLLAAGSGARVPGSGGKQAVDGGAGALTGPHAFLGRDRRAIVTQPGEVVDVDDELDLALAQILLQRQLERSRDTPHQHTQAVA